MCSCYHPNLKKLKEEDVERFTLKGSERYAKVLSVYDGDTCDVAFYRDEGMTDVVRYKCRMSGYDAPELQNKPDAKVARDYLAYLCAGGDSDDAGNDFFNPKKIWSKEQLQNQLDSSDSLVSAVFGREGKYGRPVVTLYQTSSSGIFAPNIRVTMSINDMMKEFMDQLG